MGHHELAHAVRLVGDDTGDVGAAGGELVMQRVDPLAEDAHDRGGRRGRVGIQSQVGIAQTKTGVARRIFPGKRCGKAQLVAIVSKRRGHVFDMEDSCQSRYTIRWTGHLDVPSHAIGRLLPLCGKR
jgi:hypothetical protein